MRRAKKVLKSEEGQLLPFIAVIVILLILFTALEFGLSEAYLSRARIRDALDAAVLSAVSTADVETVPTSYGEKRKTDENGVRYWVKTTSNRKDRLEISESAASEIAEDYFKKNLKLSNLKGYKILSFDIRIVRDPYKVQMVKRRPHTEGVTRSWEENFPRWIRVESTARIQVPSPVGSVLGKDAMVVEVSSKSRKNLLNVSKGVFK